MPAILENIKKAIFEKWGSFNTAVAPTRLNPEDSPRCQNVWTDEKLGSLVSAPGYIKIGTTPSGNPARFSHVFQRTDGTQLTLISDNATVWTTKDFVTFTSIITGLSSTFQLRAVTVRDKVWFTNGSDSVRTYDGATVVVLDGTAGTPTVPKGRYPFFWQERVWMLDCSGSRSKGAYSALVDTSGAAIAPDNASAWPSANAVQYQENDGDNLYGGKVYKGILYAFKERHIYRTIGQDEFTYGYSPTLAALGTRFNESIQERDDLLEFIGRDGVYEFDGQTTRRLTDNLDAQDTSILSIRGIQQLKNQQKYRLWNSQSDFNAGSLGSGMSVSRVTGQVQIDQFTYAPTALPENSTPAWTKETWRNTGVTLQAGGLLRLFASNNYFVNNPAPGANVGQVQYFLNQSLSNTNGTRVQVGLRFANSSVTTAYFFLCVSDVTRIAIMKVYSNKVTVENGSGTEIISYTLDTTTSRHTYDLKISGAVATLYVDGTSQGTGTPGTTFTSSAYLNGSMAQGGGIPKAYEATGGICFGVYTALSNTQEQNISVDLDTLEAIMSTSSTTWTSEKYLITDTIAAWGPLLSTFDRMGETLTFKVRTATTALGLDGASYTTYVPGVIVDVSTANVWAQVQITFSSSSTRTPIVYDLSLNWVVGSSGAIYTDQNVVAVVYKNRYYLSFAYLGNSTNNTIIVRGKRFYGISALGALAQVGGGSFMQLSGFNILSFFIFQDQLFGTDSTNGNIYRMDTGYSLDGASMTCSWETRDEIGEEADDLDKIVKEITIDGVRKGNFTLFVDISTDNGMTFPSANQKVISLSGSGRFLKRLLYSNVHGRQFRIRFRTVGIDQPLEINKAKAFYRERNFKP